MASAEIALNFIRQCPVHQRYGHHVLTGFFGRLAHGFRHFLRLTETEADLSVAVTNNDQGAEAEATTAFHNLGDPVQAYYFLYETGVLRLLLLIHFLSCVIDATRHCYSERPAFTRQARIRTPAHLHGRLRQEP